MDEIIRKVDLAMNACNLSGIVISWGQWMPEINNDAHRLGIAQNEHPLNVVMADKVAQLSGSEKDGRAMNAYGWLQSKIESLDRAANEG